MEEIKVGDYVRSEIGSFGKVTRIEDNKFLYENKTLITFIRNVKKHSPNIIDVLEKGDIATMKYRHLDVIKPLNETDIADLKSGELKLVSVVTHESFNSIKYEVI